MTLCLQSANMKEQCCSAGFKLTSRLHVIVLHPIVSQLNLAIPYNIFYIVSYCLRQAVETRSLS